MLYRAHLGAGLAAGVVVAATAHGVLPHTAPAQLARLAALTTAFALAPDLDVGSVPQRWFYRAIALLLAGLLLARQPETAALLGLCALLPLLHHHRGWMHRWWSAALVPAGVLVLWASLARGYPALPGMTALHLLPQQLLALVAEHLLAYAAMVCGYATHLVVDRVGLRGLRLL